MSLTNKSASHSFVHIACKPGSQAVTGEVSSLPQEPMPDFHLLIAPAYAWLYRHLREVRFQQRGDDIFSGGVRGVYLEGGKQFSQSYRWSIDKRSCPEYEADRAMRGWQPG